jgi:hypothetical protein
MIVTVSRELLAAGWTVRGSNPSGGEIFYTCLDQLWGPPNLLNNEYLVFSGGKAAGAWRWPPTPNSAEVKGGWIQITLTSVEWDHFSYRWSAHTVLRWRGNASRFDQVWSVCRAVVVSSSLFVQLWTRNGCLVMCMHLKYLFVYFQGVCTLVWRDVGKICAERPSCRPSKFFPIRHSSLVIQCFVLVIDSVVK